MIRTLLVDDHEIMLEGLAALLMSEPDIEVVGQAREGREAIERVQELQPDVVVMDVSMAGMNGIEATRIIKRQAPHVRVIGLSMNRGEETETRMRDAGATAYLTKGGPSAALVAAIRR